MFILQLETVCKRVGVDHTNAQKEMYTHKDENELISGEENGVRVVKPLSKIANPTKYPNLAELYGKLAIFFSTTHLVETTFSALSQIKSKYRSNMKDTTLDILLRCATAEEEPDFKRLLLCHDESHVSHR